eukprot:353449-Rhodomonas_salina.5
MPGSARTHHRRLLPLYQLLTAFWHRHAARAQTDAATLDPTIPAPPAQFPAAATQRRPQPTAQGLLQLRLYRELCGCAQDPAPEEGTRGTQRHSCEPPPSFSNEDV